LANGDRLTRAEFERRYEAMPWLKKAELIDGVVHMPSPVRIEEHGEEHAGLVTWLGVYRAATPGLQLADNSTVRLEGENEPQPDALLRLLPSYGGQSKTSADGYVEGAPELAAEVTSSSANYDLHDKLEAYQANRVLEYIVWRVLDKAIDWFVLRRGKYHRLALDRGLYKSAIFPGLWLDPAALLRGDLAKVLAVVQHGISTEEHALFVSQLKAKAKTAKPKKKR
jgi:Uma2 family endonuclease